MTRVLVVFESMFGDTETVARAVAEGLTEALGGSGTVDLRRAAPGVTLDGVDLLVAGGPTHAFSMTRPATRKSAGEQGAPADLAGGPGLREWIEALAVPAGAVPGFATFDTRIKKRGVPGSAAKSAEKRLRHRGLRVVTPAASFWVADTAGPLLEGERERARAWGAALAGRLQPA